MRFMGIRHIEIQGFRFMRFRTGEGPTLNLFTAVRLMTFFDPWQAGENAMTYSEHPFVIATVNE